MDGLFQISDEYVSVEDGEGLFKGADDAIGIDKGLFWHLSASLQRVAYGYSLAAIAGIARPPAEVSS